MDTVSLNSTLRIVVLMGGPSSEYGISIQSGRAISDALESAGFSVHRIAFKEAELPAFDAKIDVVFPALHGTFGEDGTVQALLEERSIPYVGCNSASSRRIMNKAQSKALLEVQKIPVPPGILLKQGEPYDMSDLRLPLIVKPNQQGSTLGVSLVTKKSMLANALKQAFRYDRQILIEEYIPGPEIAVAILQRQVLPIVEIIPAAELFDYTCKYDKASKTQYICPPKQLSKVLQEEIQALAQRTFDILQARDLLRLDMIIDERNQKPTILEGNSMPGFTEKSLLPKAAAAHGLSFPELCTKLVLDAADRNR